MLLIICFPVTQLFDKLLPIVQIGHFLVLCYQVLVVNLGFLDFGDRFLPSFLNLFDLFISDLSTITTIAHLSIIKVVLSARLHLSSDRLAFELLEQFALVFMIFLDHGLSTPFLSFIELVTFFFDLLAIFNILFPLLCETSIPFEGLQVMISCHLSLRLFHHMF